ncbi:MAG: tryptophan--tRNA ligase [Candidatus Kryptoniota bacterium]
MLIFFPEPEAKLTKFARLPGLDGKKMSKSLNNAILLSDPPDEVKKKMKKAITDPQKIRKGDPGRPDICLVYMYHQKFNPVQEMEIRRGCESGELGCVDCKMRAAEKINELLDPFRERRALYESKPQEIMKILKNGEHRARSIAGKTMAEVHQAMKVG